MQHLKLVLFAFVAVVCALAVESFPAEADLHSAEIPPKGQVKTLKKDFFNKLLGAAVLGSAYVFVNYAALGVPVGGEQEGEEVQYITPAEYVAQHGGLQGIVNELKGTAQYTLQGVSSALAGVDMGSLTASLGLPPAVQSMASNVDLTSILTKLLMGAATAGATGGVLNYATGTVFLQKLGEMMPSLQPSLGGLQALFSLANKAGSCQGGACQKNPESLIQQAIGSHNLSGNLSSMLMKAAPMALQAVTGGDTNAAMKAISTLTGGQSVAPSLLANVLSGVTSTAEEFRHIGAALQHQQQQQY